MMPLRLHLVVCLRSDERRETVVGCIGRAGDGVVRGALCAVRVAPLATARVRAFVWVQCVGPDRTRHWGTDSGHQVWHQAAAAP